MAQEKNKVSKDKEIITVKEAMKLLGSEANSLDVKQVKALVTELETVARIFLDKSS